MSGTRAPSAPLKWETFITTRPSLSRDAPAGKDELKWVPNTVTLIYGARDAVLVDTFLTIEASKKLADWVRRSTRSILASAADPIPSSLILRPFP
jgi:hypothetical protein